MYFVEVIDGEPPKVYRAEDLEALIDHKDRGKKFKINDYMRMHGRTIVCSVDFTDGQPLKNLYSHRITDEWRLYYLHWSTRDLKAFFAFNTVEELAAHHWDAELKKPMARVAVFLAAVEAAERDEPETTAEAAPLLLLPPPSHFQDCPLFDAPAGESNAPHSGA